MESYSVRELMSTDAEALLAFEMDNRDWFESRIDPRDPSFYSMQGVAEHIDDYLQGFAAGTWHPFVIENRAGSIVGRANLKSINAQPGSAEVGYRIAQHAGGQGLATLALMRLIQEAQLHWRLTRLVAYVYEENVASRHVLQRCGFQPEPPACNADISGNERRYALALEPPRGQAVQL